MSTLAALAALPAALLAVWVLLRSRVSRGLERTPDATRWHARADAARRRRRHLPRPHASGSGSRSLVGPLTASEQLLGIYAGASLLFLAGLVDDVRTLPPLAKLGAQFVAAGIVLATGTGVELVHTPLAGDPARRSSGSSG